MPFEKSQSVQALFYMVACLDMQIEQKSQSNYSDNSKGKKKFWTEKKKYFGEPEPSGLFVFADQLTR